MNTSLPLTDGKRSKSPGSLLVRSYKEHQTGGSKHIIMFKEYLLIIFTNTQDLRVILVPHSSSQDQLILLSRALEVEDTRVEPEVFIAKGDANGKKSESLSILISVSMADRERVTVKSDYDKKTEDFPCDDKLICSYFRLPRWRTRGIPWKRSSNGTWWLQPKLPPELRGRSPTSSWSSC